MKKLLMALSLTTSINAFGDDMILKIDKVQHNGLEINLPTVLVNNDVCKTFVSSSTDSSFSLAQICDVPNVKGEPSGLESFTWNAVKGRHEFHLKTGRIEGL